MERILMMSKKERERLFEVKLVEEGKQTILKMAEKLKMSYRHARRIMKRYREEGDAGLCHRSWGRPSNRKLSDEIRKQVLELCENRCAESHKKTQ